MKKGILDKGEFVEIRTTIRLDKIVHKELIEILNNSTKPLSKVVVDMLYNNTTIIKQQSIISAEADWTWTPPDISIEV